MKKLLAVLLSGLLISPFSAFAADNSITVTNGTDVNLRSIDIGGGIQAPGHVIVNSSGTNIVGAGTTMPVSGTLTAVTTVTTVTTLGTITNALPAGTNVIGHVIADTGSTTAVTQATAASLNATVVGTGTFAVQAAQSGTWNITNISGTISLPTLASTSTKQSDGSQKTQIVDGSGNVISSTATNLNVQCANCSGSGASAVDGATFTVGSSVFAPAGGQYTSGGATACVTGKQCMAGITSARELMVSDAALLTAANSPLPGMPINKTWAGCSGSGTATGTASVASAASSTRAGGTIMNLSGDIEWISFTGTATVGGANNSFPLGPYASGYGGSWTFPEGSGYNGNLSIVSAGTSSAYSCVTHG